MTVRAELEVAESLARFVEQRVLPGLAIDAASFWEGLAALVAEFSPRNAALLRRRDELQAALDGWFAQARASSAADPQALGGTAYLDMLRRVGYLVDEPAPFTIETADVDDELCRIAGPQLVVPVSNARYALNAANARWGSLYDALYGTDAIGDDDGAARGKAYNPVRGARVVARAKQFLDLAAPLQSGSHAQATGYTIEQGQLRVQLGTATTGLAQPEKFVGFRGSAQAPKALLLRNHGLHAEIVIDRNHPVGRGDAAGVADVVLESAVTTICDCEDSVCAVDAADKVQVYENWLGLMQGKLAATFDKGGREVARTLNDDREYQGPKGGTLRLAGRSTLLVRNVGIHMYTDAVVDSERRPIPEGLLDAYVTAAIALHNTLPGAAMRRNSRHGSVYIVKPKLHGPEEVRFAVDVFARVEQLLGMPANTLKIGVMDEERRTSANLAACIHAARSRLVFINTGFLDRTGDEIHSAMAAGAVVRKSQMRTTSWIKAYEDRNVAIGLACGLHGRAQIGKGMWAAPDRMADMLQQKIGHPRAGATTAWVPSPTAATLHAMHYHEVDVMQVQQSMMGRAAPGIEPLLQLPLSAPGQYSSEDIQVELEESAQSLLGYVVRWIDQGVGCSKVPDIHDVGLMEDRATLRISSQLLANWLHHGLLTRPQLDSTLRKMALVVDRQNAGEAGYRPMAPAFDGPAFAAAVELVIDGVTQPNGYTEPTLHKWRRVVKAAG